MPMKKDRLKSMSILQTNIAISMPSEMLFEVLCLHIKRKRKALWLAEIIAGQKPHIDYNLIPGVVYTWPEVASVGKTEEQLKESGLDYKMGSFPMRALGRARASMDIDGMIKVLADAKTDEILGCSYDRSKSC